MMTSIQKQLQQLQMRLKQENDHSDHNRGSSQMHHQQQQTPPPVPQRQISQSPQIQSRQYVSPPTTAPFTNRRVHNSNLQLNLNRNPIVNQNRHNQNITAGHDNGSAIINAQCLSPRPRPRQLAIGNNVISGRSGSPSRVKPLDLLFPSRDNFQSGLRNNNSNDEMKLHEVFKQNNSVLTIDGNKYSAQEEDLQYLDELGSGSCGHVVKMLHLPSGKIVAVKQMRRSGNKEENKRIKMDLDILLACHDCPHIVQCYGYFIKDTEVWICMELMSTCFDKLLKKLKSPIPEPILGKISVATLKGLNYLKDVHRVIHRDVKPSNILINDKGVVKLCDFGISGRLVDSKAKTRSAGCAAYMAPERIDPPDTANPSYDIRADVWSLGISLVELATGKFPYHECRTDFEVLTKVIQEDPPSLPSDKSYSLELCSFVKACLTKDYRNRPKYKKLLEHPFIQHYDEEYVNVENWFGNVIAIDTDNNSMSELSPSPAN